MGNTRKKKYASGEGSQYLSRRSALKKLQLSLKDFRKLCIIKGIYPREPRNRKRAQQGQTGIKTLYAKKDIQFLLHEPIIWKLRENLTFTRKVQKAKALRDFKTAKKIMYNHPSLKLDHIVKERYPTFVDALRDLDDCLTLCFLFSTFPSMAHVPRDQSTLCRRLTVEFMHAVIEAKALRKVFISIKGYYYQAEFRGVAINWITPHHFSFKPESRDEVDFKIMATFVEFYTVLLGFVNFRLFHELNMFYPPKFQATSTAEEKKLIDEETYVSERIAALNLPLTRTITDDVATEEVEVDTFHMDDDPEKIEEAKREAEQIKKLKTLFVGKKFYINREVPREPLVFVIRCFGGEVSWDKDSFVGSTFEETDESITHQIVDRPAMDKLYISRYYIQPQWVFDSVNVRELLPERKYFIGAVLPPHLSPFSDEVRTQEYIPPEEKALKDPSLAEVTRESEESDLEVEEEEPVDEVANSKKVAMETERNKKAKKNKQVIKEKTEVKEIKEKNKKNAENSDSEDAGMVSDDEDPDPIIIKEKVWPKTAEEKEALKQEMLKKMRVTSGELFKENPWENDRIAKQEYRLREKMIKKKHRKLYKSMMDGKQERAKAIWLLRKKRRLHDEQAKEEAKAKKKAARAAN